MPKLPIEFEKTRDFGEVVNDTFTFIRQNFRPLLICTLTFCGIFILGGMVALFFQQLRITQLLSSTDGYGTETNVSSGLTASRFVSLSYYITIIFILLTYSMLFVSTLCYISLYKSKGNRKPETAEIWGYVKYFYLRVLGAMFLLALCFGGAFGLFVLFGYGGRSLSTIIFGFLVCGVLFVWLYPVTFIMFPVMVLENTSIWYAFKHSLWLIKNNWWITFVTLFIVGLITFLSSLIFAIPGSIAAYMILFIGVKASSSTALILSLFTSVFKQLSYVFYIIPVIGAALCYSNLSEVKEGTGMLNRIQQFGHTDLEVPDNTEQY